MDKKPTPLHVGKATAQLVAALNCLITTVALTGAAHALDTLQTGPDFVVNSNADTNDGSRRVSDCTPREAIAVADTDADVSVITFDATVFARKQTITVVRRMA